MFSRLMITNLIFVTFVCAFVSSFDYCKIKCKRKNQSFNHTVCERPSCSYEATCRNVQQIPLSTDEKNQILHVHNKYRNLVASGREKPQPAAANMMELKWDTELAYIAQCWANACQYEHDKCRDTSKREYVGQNIGLFGTTGKMKLLQGVKPLERIITYWYNEVQQIKNVSVIKAFKANKAYGHYTQLVWAKTDRIGCARVFGYTDKRNKRFHRVFLYCNYASAGNFLRWSVYQVGQPCSQCRCSTKYPALCENTRKIENSLL